MPYFLFSAIFMTEFFKKLLTLRLKTLMDSMTQYDYFS